MAIDEKEFGRLIGHLESMAPAITEIKDDMKKVLSCQAATEERLKNGNKRFETYDGEIPKIWRAIRMRADWRIIYPLIAGLGGFLIFLIDHYYKK
jgi:hypothetical protein